MQHVVLTQPLQLVEVLDIDRALRLPYLLECHITEHHRLTDRIAPLDTRALAGFSRARELVIVQSRPPVEVGLNLLIGVVVLARRHLVRMLMREVLTRSRNAPGA